MSAFLVTKGHIDVLVYASQLLRIMSRSSTGRPITESGMAELGRMLWRENMCSIAYRYKDQPLDERLLEEYNYVRPGELMIKGRNGIVQIIKAIHCYEYQSCEHEGWEASKANRYCQETVRSLIQYLPGYDEARWSLP